MAYGKTDRSKREKLGGQLTSGDWFKFPQGRSVVRVMPPWNEDCGRWWSTWMIHWVNSATGDRKGKTALPCLKVHGDGSCAICDAYRALMASGNSADEKLAGNNDDGYKAGKNHMVTLVDVKNSAAGPTICNCPKTAMQVFQKYDADTEGGWGDIVDPENGYNIVMDKDPSNNRYSGNAVKEPSAIDDMSWVDDLPDLDDAFKVYSYEEQLTFLPSRIRSMVDEGAGSGDGDDEEVDTPPPAKAKSKAKSGGKAETKSKPEVAVRDDDDKPVTPPCFADADVYDEDDKVCKKCDVFESCGKRVAAAAAKA